jgi:hypothetical protein
MKNKAYFAFLILLLIFIASAIAYGINRTNQRRAWCRDHGYTPSSLYGNWNIVVCERADHLLLAPGD